MPITDINARTHPITDTDIRYEGHSVAVGLLLMPYSLPPPRYSSTVSELAGRIGVWATHLYAWIKWPSVTVLQSTDQEVEAGWGDTVSKHSIKLWSKPPNKRQERNRPSSHVAATLASQRVCSLIEMITHDYITNAGNPAYTSLQQCSMHVIT